VAETHEIMLSNDREWFDKALSQQQASTTPRANRLDRAQLDSVLAEKLRDIIRELRSPSQRPLRITKSGLLRRAGCLPKYDSFSTELPVTTALIREHAETRTDYLIRKIKWAVAEMSRDRQAIRIDLLRRKAALPARQLKEYKQLVLETAKQLGANVPLGSFFAQDA